MLLGTKYFKTDGQGAFIFGSAPWSSKLRSMRDKKKSISPKTIFYYDLSEWTGPKVNIEPTFSSGPCSVVFVFSDQLLSLLQIMLFLLLNTEYKYVIMNVIIIFV